MSWGFLPNADGVWPDPTQDAAVTRVLLVDDEPALLESLCFVLSRDGFEPLTAHSLQEAALHLEQSTMDLIVLDLTLPDGDGLSLLERVRIHGLMPPIIVLSSRAGEADRVRALESGADDYVTKPFSPREMVARIRAVLRRAQGDAAIPVRLLHVDPKTRRASVGQRALDLTRAEFDILALLDSEPGSVFSRARIIDAIWGNGFALSDRTIDSHVKALRRKIVESSGNAAWIETVRGVGYRLGDGSGTI
jgi:DNA-binding response OmpR family regulator